MRARSPRAMCWVSVSVSTSRVPVCASASRLARSAIPVAAAAGVSDASSTAFTSPDSATARNGKPRHTASSCAPPRRGTPGSALSRARIPS